MRLYDSSNIDTLVWPDTEQGKKARDYLLPLVRNGIQSYISNAKTSFYVLAFDDLVLPVTVNAQEYDNSYVVSNYYAIPLLEEKMANRPSWLNRLKKPFIRLGGRLLKSMRINKVVIVNNWLVSTCVQSELTASQLNKITTFLQESFSDHLIMFRNVNGLKESGLCRNLAEKKYHLFGTRMIYVYDPKLKETLSPKVHYHHRRDKRLIEKNGYEVFTEVDLSPEDIPRLLELYTNVYIGKYTDYSPKYTEKFLINALEQRSWHFMGVRREGKIDGVYGYFVHNGIMTVPFFGHETNLPPQMGLYRMLTILIIQEAERLDVLLNDSSGAEAPKKYRGMKPHPEYTAIYARHLPLVRQFLWKGMAAIYNRTVFPAIKRKVP